MRKYSYFCGVWTNKNFQRSHLAFPVKTFRNATISIRWDINAWLPMVNPGNKRFIQLPKGQWRDNLGKVHNGGKGMEVDIPLNRIPYFERLSFNQVFILAPSRLRK